MVYYPRMTPLFIDTFIGYATNVVPWFLLGVAVAFVVERKVAPSSVSAWLGKGGPKRVLAAFATGMVSPLSIMPQLPVSGELVRLGASPALMLGFLAAERSYDFQSFPIIAGFFGIRFAVLNAAAIYLSLMVAFLSLRRRKVRFRASADGKKSNGFWKRQARLFAVVIAGIALAAAVRAAVPEDAFRTIAASGPGGMLTGTVAGFALYFGTILGNYPAARAFADLGMSMTGVFTFLTVSPLLNAVVIGLFASAAHWKDVLRFFAAYAVTGLLLSAVVGTFLV